MAPIKWTSELSLPEAVVVHDALVAFRQSALNGIAYNERQRAEKLEADPNYIPDKWNADRDVKDTRIIAVVNKLIGEEVSDADA